MNVPSRVWLFATMTICMTGITGGCGARPIFGDLFKHPNSYLLDDEKVVIRMLNKEEMKALPTGAVDVTADQWTNHLKGQFPGLFEEPETDDEASIRAVPLIPVVIGYAAGYAVDQLKAQLEAEAELYEAQFSATLYKSGFWQTLPNDASRALPNYYGIEICRYARGYPGPDVPQPKPAYRLICAIAPANALVSDENAAPVDERIFALKPLLFETNASRAKVLMTNPKLNSRANIRIDAVWIDQQQTVHQTQVAAAEFEFKGHDLGTPKAQLLSNRIAGWFGGLPVSIALDGTPKGNGAFKVTAIVTETDPSHAKKAFERIARSVGDNRENIVKAVTPAKPAVPASRASDDTPRAASGQTQPFDREVHHGQETRFIGQVRQKPNTTRGSRCIAACRKVRDGFAPDRRASDADRGVRGDVGGTLVNRTLFRAASGHRRQAGPGGQAVVRRNRACDGGGGGNGTVRL